MAYVVQRDMKIYESIVTYLPFLYLYVMATMFGALYHNAGIDFFQPYIVLCFVLVNTFVYYMHDTEALVKAAVHRHVWRTVTMSIYGILINNIHTEMFRDFHFSSWWVNVTVSFLYIFAVSLCRYYFDSDMYITYMHILFLFFPLQRVWQVNLYVYVIFTTFSVIILFRRVAVKDLKSDKLHVKPVVNYFMYLRVYDLFVCFGFIQLYMDLYMSQIPEVRAAEEIHKMMEGHREKIGKYDEDV